MVGPPLTFDLTSNSLQRSSGRECHREDPGGPVNIINPTKSNTIPQFFLRGKKRFFNSYYGSDVKFSHFFVTFPLSDVFPHSRSSSEKSGEESV